MITTKNLVLYMLLFNFLCFSQNSIPLEKNRLQGEYTSKLKGFFIKGTFENNLRKGKWTVTDSLGNIIYSRNYEKPFTYIENKKQDVTISGYEPIRRDSTGLYRYPKVNYKKVLWSKRVWSVLPKIENPYFYDKNLLDSIQKRVKTQKLIAYSDDQLSVAINRNSFDLSAMSLQGVAIKKDYYFDSSLSMMLEKIVCLTYFLSDRATGKEFSFSLYYSGDTRKLFQSFPINSKSGNIQNLDDLIFYQGLASIIYRTGTPGQKNIKPDFLNTDQYVSQSNQIMKLILETEHKYWLKEI